MRLSKLEDCFDGNSVYCYHFDQPWTRPAILQLATLGSLDYFPDFPRPFYRLSGSGGLQLKGVEGMQHCRVVILAQRQESFGQALDERLAVLRV